MDYTDESIESPRWGGLIDISARQLMQVFALGVIIGAFVWLITQFGAKILFEPLLCGEAQSCAANDAASIMASIFAGVVGIIGLIQFSIYRPIIVVIASAICLWELSSWLDGMNWAEALLWSSLLYGFCYLAFTWLVRPRSPVIFLALVASLVFAVRLLPVLLAS